MPEIKDYDADFVELKWDPPVRDGGAPITGYIVEKKDKYSPDWVPVKEVEGNIPKAKVTGLNEGDKYEFRVRAVNKAGPGEPSQSTSPHLSKPKNCKSQNLKFLNLSVSSFFVKVILKQCFVIFLLEIILKILRNIWYKYILKAWELNVTQNISLFLVNEFK